MSDRSKHAAKAEAPKVSAPSAPPPPPVVSDEEKSVAEPVPPPVDTYIPSPRRVSQE